MTHESCTLGEFEAAPSGPQNPWPSDEELVQLAEEALEACRNQGAAPDRPRIRRYFIWDDVYLDY